ncbi:hypothetical protein ACFL09_01530 [Planctomycetota bacterium]
MTQTSIRDRGDRSGHTPKCLLGRVRRRAINRGAVDAERQLRAGCDQPPSAPEEPRL